MRTAITLITIALLGAGRAFADPDPPDGAAVFHTRCAPCHGESGKTDTESARALKVRPLTDDATLAQMNPAALVEAIRENPKHQGVAALVGISEAELRATAAVVRQLAQPR